MLVELLGEFSSDDFVTMSESLKIALNNHFRRVCNFNNYLVTKSNLPGYDYEKEGVHHNCTFGQWYYSQTAPQLTAHDEFITLGNIHESLHGIMRKLILKVQVGTPITFEDYTGFVQTYNNFTDRITYLIDEINYAQFQYDYLTNLINRRAFKKIIIHEYNRAQRNKTSCCLVLGDIDYFKNINDTYGHSNGDIVLVKLADFFQDRIRNYDSVGRYGGEEFIFCLPDTRINEAENIINRLREQVSELNISLLDGTTINITLSFGISELRASSSIEQSIIDTDKALYLAKESGRNCVKLWPSDDDLIT